MSAAFSGDEAGNRYILLKTLIIDWTAGVVKMICHVIADVFESRQEVQEGFPAERYRRIIIPDRL